MEFEILKYHFFWKKIQHAYNLKLAEKGYTADFAKHTIKDKEGRIAVRKEGRGTSTDNIYKGVRRFYPEFIDRKLDQSYELTIRGIIEAGKAWKEANAASFLNPFNDFYKALLPSSIEGKETIEMPDDIANIYAKFCGYQDITALLEEFGKDDIVAIYRAFFYSHVRYKVWQEGIITINYTQQMIQADGFYQKDHEASFRGKFDRNGSNLFIDMKNHNGSNHFMMILKVDPNDKNFGDILKGALLTVSSYADNFLAATEVILAKLQPTEDGKTNSLSEALQLSIRRYFLLRRTRFTVTAASKEGDFIVDPAKEEANVYSALVGNYIGFLKIKSNNQWLILRFHLTMFDDYRTVIRIIPNSNNPEVPIYLLGYLELGKLSVVHFAIIKGYMAEPGEGDSISDLPRLGQLRTILQLEYKGDLNALTGIMSITTLEGLMHGQVILLRTHEQATSQMEGIGSGNNSLAAIQEIFTKKQQSLLEQFIEKDN